MCSYISSVRWQEEVCVLLPCCVGVQVRRPRVRQSFINRCHEKVVAARTREPCMKPIIFHVVSVAILLVATIDGNEIMEHEYIIKEQVSSVRHTGCTNQ